MEYAIKIIYGLLTLIGVFITLVWKWNEDKHNERKLEGEKLRSYIKDVESNSVSKTTITRIENDWKDEILNLRKEGKEKHDENSKRLERIDNKLDRVHEQIIEWLRTAQ